MALSALCEWDVRTTGSDTNGGAFKRTASGTDWSMQDAAQYSVTDAVTAGTTTVTSATANFGTDVVGNVAYIAGGTGSITAGWYEITARNSSTSITVDRSTGLTTGTGVTLKIGGALASPGLAAGKSVSQNRIHIKSGTYVITTTSVNVAGGPIDLPAVSGTYTRLIGYEANHYDDCPSASSDTRPVLQLQASLTTSAINIVKLPILGECSFLVADANTGNTNATGFHGQEYRTSAFRCKAYRCTVNGFNAHRVVECEASTCSGTAGFTVGGAFNCLADSNTTAGFAAYGSLACSFNGCIASNNSGASSDGFTNGGNPATYTNCVAHNNGRHGFFANTYNCHLLSCIATSNGGYGFRSASGNYNRMYNCAADSSNTSGNYVSADWTVISGFVTLTGNPFTNAASGDFTLDSTSGEGAACRGAGRGTLPPHYNSLNVGYPDIGAIQHQDSGGGGGSGVVKFAGNGGGFVG